MKLIVATLIVVAAVSAAQAQTVYRCANTYSQAPCPQATLVEVGDERSAAQQAEARRVAADERRLAADMRRERLADERATRVGGAASLSGHAPAKLVALEPRHKKKRAALKPQTSTDFVAYDPSSRKRRD
ncbi:MAG: hypothetical protein ABI433_18590 [Burkholderiaceae bacterium]